MSDPVMVHWWCTDDALMMHWWCSDDALMMHCWCAEDALIMHWWHADDALMMQSWCTDDTLKMHWWCSDDHHMRIWWWWHAARIISLQKIYGLYSLKPHIVEISEDVTNAGLTIPMVVFAVQFKVLQFASEHWALSSQSKKPSGSRLLLRIPS